MRTIKNSDIRKKEILDAAAILFDKKGYDGTSTNDILDAVGIARGTLYHHFKSKEDIMDGLIARQMETIVSAAREIADDKSIPIKERMVRTILSLNVSEEGNESEAMIEHLHKPQNALMHQKTNHIMIQQIPPILAGIVEDGVAEGLFHTKYPLECMELSFVYLKTISDDGVLELTPEQLFTRIKAFVFHLEKLLDVEPGGLDFMLKLFGSEE